MTPIPPHTTWSKPTYALIRQLQMPYTYTILSALENSPEPPFETDVATQLAASPTRASLLVDRLVEAGLVEAERVTVRGSDWRRYRDRMKEYEEKKAVAAAVAYDYAASAGKRPVERPYPPTPRPESEEGTITVRLLKLTPLGRRIGEKFNREFTKSELQRGD